METENGGSGGEKQGSETKPANPEIITEHRDRNGRLLNDLEWDIYNYNELIKSVNVMIYHISVILHIPPEEIPAKYSLRQLLIVYTEVVKAHNQLTIGNAFIGSESISQGNGDNNHIPEFCDITEDMPDEMIIRYYQNRKTDWASLADILPSGGKR